MESAPEGTPEIDDFATNVFLQGKGKIVPLKDGMSYVVQDDSYFSKITLECQSMQYKFS